jgi:hypothetical protein
MHAYDDPDVSRLKLTRVRWEHLWLATQVGLLGFS